MIASGGSGNYQWAGSGLPDGLTLGAEGGISGMPVGPGASRLSVSVTDSETHQTVSAQLAMSVSGALTITTSSPLPSGTPGSAYPSLTIAVTGGAPPYTFYAQPPDGLTLSSSGTLTGTPTVSGIFSFLVTVVDSANNSDAKEFSIAIISTATSLLEAAPANLSFSATQGGDSPSSQSIVVLGSAASPANFTVSLDSGSSNSPAPAWLAVKQLTGVTPTRLVVSANTSGMSAGSYSGRIEITDSSDASTYIPVTLAISSQAPALSVGPGILRFTAMVQSSSPQQTILALDNTGGSGPLPFSIQVLGGSPWINGVTPNTGQIAPNSPVFLQVQVNGDGLDAGRYRDVVRIISPAGNVDVPVVLVVTPNAPVLGLNVLGLRFQARQSGGSSSTQTFEVLNTGAPASTVNWTAQIIQGSDFLSLNTASGEATPTAPSQVTVSLQPSATQATPRAYYGLISFSDTNSLDSPQYLVVVLDLAGADASPLPDVQPAGLLFVAPAGGQAATQTLTVNTSSAAPIPFQTSTSTLDGAAWLSVNPGSGQSSGSSSGTTTVSVNTAGLTPGIYHGEIDVAISNVLRAVNVVLIVQPIGTTVNAAAPGPQVVCSPTQLAITETGMVNNFAVPAGWPATLSVRLNDDCGNSVPNANVVASFSNGDPPLTLLRDAQGTYSATWQPGATSTQVQVTLQAVANSMPPAQFQILGSISANQVPVLARNGTLHNLNPVVGGALAPGTVAQVYGSALASTALAPNILPLPPSFNGTNVIVGGFSAPLFYLSSGQLNVQIPNELTPNQTYPIVVSVNGALTLPDLIDIVPAMPGVAAYSNGDIIAQHSADYSLVTEQNPAQPGEYLIMYLAGMGPTDPSIASGQPAPSVEPLGRVMLQPIVTVAGQNANLAYAGLTPGAAGLYQIDFQVPSNIASGDLPVTVTQDGQAANATTLPVSQ